MWNRTRYNNQWSNRREAAYIVAVFGAMMTLVVYHLLGSVSRDTLRWMLTLVIMSVPVIVCIGHWFGTTEVRGYKAGVSEKMQRTHQYGVYIPPDYPALPEPDITHKEPINAS